MPLLPSPCARASHPRAPALAPRPTTPGLPRRGTLHAMPEAVTPSGMCGTPGSTSVGSVER
eukprot:349785-Chlamydomonas_euryale.AAC.3